MEMLSRSVDMPAAQAHCGKHALPDPSARRYEDIVLLASIICETPIAFIILFDSDRIWIKEKIGLDISVIPEEGAFRWRMTAEKSSSPCVSWIAGCAYCLKRKNKPCAH